MQTVTHIKKHGPVAMHTAAWFVMVSPLIAFALALLSGVVPLLTKHDENGNSNKWYREPNPECTLLDKKLRNGKIQLKIFCKASVHADPAIKQRKGPTTNNNRKEITCMEALTV